MCEELSPSGKQWIRAREGKEKVWEKFGNVARHLERRASRIFARAVGGICRGIA